MLIDEHSKLFPSCHEIEYQTLYSMTQFFKCLTISIMTDMTPNTDFLDICNRTVIVVDDDYTLLK